MAAHFRFVLESRPVGTDTVGAGHLVCMDFVASQRRGLQSAQDQLRVI